MQAESKDQKLLIVISDDELPTGKKEDKKTYMKAAKTVFKNQCELDNTETHLLFDKAKDIIVKEECFTSEDNADNEFYDKFVNSIKHESISSDSDVSMLENKDSSSNSENKATEPEKNQVKIIIKGITAFSCSMCNKNFTSKSKLTKHIKIIHNGVRNFECCVCNKKFKYERSLIVHEKLHTGVKKFECSVCNKRFSQKIHLNLHASIHTGIKKYECSICNQKFSQKRTLSLHEETHVGGNFECSLCNKKFMYKRSLVSHEKYQICVKKFECSVCNQKFSQKRHLIAHEKMYKYKDLNM